MQSFYRISENGGWVKITTDAYYTPNDVCIHGVGITPDIVIDLPEELQGTALELINPLEDTQLQRALALFGTQASAGVCASR